MPLKKTTFRRYYDEEHFVSEEWINDQGLVVYSKRIEEGHTGEFKAQYDEAGNKLAEEHWEDEELANRMEWHYYENGQGVEKRTYYGAELYEREIIEPYDEGEVRRLIQDGEEVERSVRKGDAENYVMKFYTNGFLAEVQTRTFDPETRKAVVHATDDREIPGTGTRIEEDFDRYGRMIAYREYHNGGSLFVRSAFTYEGERVLTETTENLADGEAYKLVNTYDEKGRLLKEATHTLADQLVAFHSYAYDDQGRCVEEVVYAVGRNDNMVPGERMNKVHDTFVHYYEAL